jgi:hypothetical protein
MAAQATGRTTALMRREPTPNRITADAEELLQCFLDEDAIHSDGQVFLEALSPPESSTASDQNIPGWRADVRRNHTSYGESQTSVFQLPAIRRAGFPRMCEVLCSSVKPGGFPRFLLSKKLTRYRPARSLKLLVLGG